MRKISLLGLSLALILASLSPVLHAQGKNSKAAKAAESYGSAETITAAQLKEILTFIASDELEGRDTPSRGLDIAAKFIAFNLSRWGFKPAGDNGTFFQRFALRRGQLDGAQTKLEFNGASYKMNDDFIPRSALGSAKGPLVYVGHGLVVKAKNLNAYEGVEVKDKIVVAAEGAFPKGVQPGDLKGKLGVDYDTATSYARAHGAKGLLLVPAPNVLSRWDVMGRFMNSGRTALGQPQEANDLPAAIASQKLLDAFFQGEQLDGAAILKQAATGDFGASFALKADKQVNLTVGGKLEVLPTQNVVAIWEGSDPSLKNEYIAVGAHYDHVGVRPASDEGKTDGWTRYRLFLESAGRLGGADKLSNGADDDGSGTTAVLAIAETLAKGPRPKRSVLLVWHAGEEKGLWGSEYVTDHPPVPVSQIVTQLNIDMIGRSKPAGDGKESNKNLSTADEIYVIGSKMMSTELGEVSEAVNNSYLKLQFNYKYDDPNDRERLFYRSDHFNYARKGIPIIFYFDGVHEDYHGVGDHPDKIDYVKMEKVTRTVYATLWELANRATRVKVDKPLPAQYSGN